VTADYRGKDAVPLPGLLFRLAAAATTLATELLQAMTG